MYNAIFKDVYSFIVYLFSYTGDKKLFLENIFLWGSLEPVKQIKDI